MKEKFDKVINKVKELVKKLPKIDTTKLKTFGNKIKEAFGKMKEGLKKIDVLKKLVIMARKYRLILSLAFFCVTALILILVATLGWQEFVVPVCILMIIEAAMAVLLHKTELWIHGILMAAHIVVGVVIDRLPMIILCMIAYVAATITLQFAFKKENHE